MSKFKYYANIRKEKSLKCIEIPLDIYKCSVIVIMSKEAKILEKDWGKGGYGGTTTSYLKEQNEVLITLEKPTLDNIAHEFLHAVQFIMKWIGHDIENKDGGDEPSAYLLGYLIKEFNKKRKLCKKKTK